jgi:hypothetical protein
MKERLSSLGKSLRPSKKKILPIVIAIVVTLILSSLISMWLDEVTDFTFPTIGTFRWRGIEGYWDSNLTNKTKACDWGTIWPGASRNVSLYLRSTSNIKTILNLTTGNWTFWDSNNKLVEGMNSSSNHMSLTWNYSGSTIDPGEIVQVTLTLSISRSYDFITYLTAKDITRFSFDILIRTE